MVNKISRLYQLVHLIKTCDKIAGRTKLQKMIFLLQKEYKAQLDYKFKPWIYGPFSKEINEDLELLISEGLVEEETEQLRSNEKQEVIRYNYRITKEGKKFLESNLVNIPIINMDLLEEIAPHLNRTSTHELLQQIYENPRYKDYIVKSVLVD